MLAKLHRQLIIKIYTYLGDDNQDVILGIRSCKHIYSIIKETKDYLILYYGMKWREYLNKKIIEEQKNKISEGKVAIELKNNLMSEAIFYVVPSFSLRKISNILLSSRELFKKYLIEYSWDQWLTKKGLCTMTPYIEILQFNKNIVNVMRNKLNMNMFTIQLHILPFIYTRLQEDDNGDHIFIHSISRVNMLNNYFEYVMNNEEAYSKLSNAFGNCRLLSKYFISIIKETGEDNFGIDILNDSPGIYKNN